MTWLYWLSAATAGLLLIYLIICLLKPENFS